MENGALDFVPWANIRYFGDEVEFAKDAIDSSWIAGGEYISKFENFIQSIYSGTAYSVSNGTAALQLALQALSVKPGDRIIVPSFCFQAAGNVLLQLGAIPVFCDVNVSTWNQSLSNIRDVYDRSIKGVIAVHNYGACHDIADIADWCRENDIWLIEDCAEAWFSRVNDKLLGQHADIATFSMHAAKTITSGEGGLLISFRNDLNEKISQLRSHGLVKAQRPYLNALAGNNYRLSNIHAAIAYGQIKKWKQIIALQRQRQNKYFECLSLIPYGILQKEYSQNIELWAIGFRLFPSSISISRDEIMDLMRSKGIDTRPGFYSTDKLGYFDDKDVYKNSSALSENIIVFPCGTNLTEVDIERICRVFKEIIDTNQLFEINLAKNGFDETEFQNFLNSVNKDTNHFRYFDKRTFDVFAQHIATVLIQKSRKTIGYGHLETENGVTWLGICVHPEYQNQSIGKTIMQALISQASASNIDNISLTVDHDNKKALKMYLSFGFKIISNDKNNIKMQLGLNE